MSAKDSGKPTRNSKLETRNGFAALHLMMCDPADRQTEKYLSRVIRAALEMLSTIDLARRLADSGYE